MAKIKIVNINYYSVDGSWKSGKHRLEAYPVEKRYDMPWMVYFGLDSTQFATHEKAVRYVSRLIELEVSR